LQRSREQLVNAREEERRRLRRDLHDELAPTLAALALTAATARDRTTHDPSTAALLDELYAGLRGAVGDIRRLVYELRPPALDERGLTEAVRDQVQAFRRMTDLDCTFESTLAERLRPDLEALLYRVTQEALANLARQARADQGRVDRVRVALHAVADAVELRIADEEHAAGPGGLGVVEVQPAQAGRQTLDEMRAQVEQAGGHWEVTPSPGGGTVIGVTFRQSGA
jgi:signal transduction histidine kinase